MLTEYKHIEPGTVFTYDGSMYKSGATYLGKTRESFPKLGGVFQKNEKLAVFIPIDAIVSID